MKKSDLWENIITLLAVILLVPVWAIKTKSLPLPDGMLKLADMLQIGLVIVLVIILVRRVRRIVVALRENKHRSGPFSF